MSKSLIRKNQLHPDIADLVNEYGSAIFVNSGQFQDEIDLITSLIPTFVSNTGNETINGIKNFTTKPQVNGVNILIEGDAANVGQNVVYTTGNQTINSAKNFTTRPTFNNIGLATTGEIGGGSTVFNGSRRITRQSINNVTPGGTDVVTFLNNLFYPYTQAVVTLNSFPLQELGRSIITIDYEGSINPGSLVFGTDINTVTAFSNNTSRTPIIPTPNDNNNTFDSNVNLGGSFSSSIPNCFVRINSKDQNGNVVIVDSNFQTIFFEAPTYAGSGALNLTDNALTLRNVLSGQSSPNNNGKYLIFEPAERTINFTTNGYYYFIYPSSWGPLAQIKDAALGFNFNINTDFTTNTINVPLIDGTNHPYRWYRNTNSIVLNNYGVTYIF